MERLAEEPEYHANSQKATGREHRVFNWQRTVSSYVAAVAFSPDGKTLACGCHGGNGLDQNDRVLLWNLATGKPSDMLLGLEGTFGLSHDDIRAAVSYTADGQTLARVTNGGRGFGFQEPLGSLILWDVRNQMQKTAHDVPGGATYAVALPPGKRVLVVSAIGPTRLGLDRADPAAASTVHLWDVVAQKGWSLATGHQGRVVSLAFSPDGSRLASGSDDNTVKLWEVARVVGGDSK